MFVRVLRNNVDRYSKLIKFVTVKPVKGTSRQNIAGTIPEAIWTEAVGALNELDIVFTQLEMDGYKVGGYVAISNSTLEDDDDLALLASVIDILGQSIGLGADKALVYGTGEKMPVGFVTRLAAKSQPTWWGKNQGIFTDLSASNVLKLDIGGKTGTEFFQTLIVALGIASPD
ncbi:MAG: phage major capsid protein, partial [Oscillospiraceae bacterium]